MTVMTVRKTFKELTIKDNFMFGAVMCKEDNCRRFWNWYWRFRLPEWK